MAGPVKLRQRPQPRGECNESREIVRQWQAKKMPDWPARVLMLAADQNVYLIRADQLSPFEGRLFGAPSRRSELAFS